MGQVSGQRWIENWLRALWSVSQSPAGDKSLAVYSWSQDWGQYCSASSLMTWITVQREFTDDTKLRGVTDTADGFATVQRNLNRLENWAERNL